MLKFRWETEFRETEIGAIPKDWEIKKLREFVIKAKNGGTPPTKNPKFWNGDIPWITSNHLTSLYVTQGERYVTKKAVDMRRTSVAEKGTLLFGTRIGIGNVAIAARDIAFNQDVTAVWLKESVVKRYLVRLFKSSYYQSFFQTIADGTTVGGIDRKTLLSIPIISPPRKEEQTRIATVLSWFDDLIENKKRQNEILENMAMAIFKSWFIDFEPFQDEEFVYSEELDIEIPKGWEVKPIGEVARIIKGVSYTSNELEDVKGGDASIFITLKVFERGGGFRPEYKYYIGNKAKKDQIVKDGDLIIALTDMTPEAKVVGAPSIVVLPPDVREGVISLDCAKLVVDKFMEEYLYMFLKYTQEENATFASGVNVLHLRVELFKKSKYIFIPPQPILQRFHSLIEPLFQKIITNQKEIMVLKKIRDALLPQLVFGRLRVEEI